MAIFNYNPGFGSMGFGNYSYGYNYGNMSSMTNVMNGIAYTQNIMNLGGGGACGNGSPTYCQEGYSFYVPCIKNITRGQNVCFQFYVADKLNQDTLDLKDLESMTVQLTGPFGCAYKSYTYPDDIKSLQEDDYREMICNEFSGRIFNFELGYLEVDFGQYTITEIEEDKVNNSDYNVNVIGRVGEFLYGEYPYLKADDSTTHIFVGWTTSERLDEVCPFFTKDDIIISDDKYFVFDEPIDRDIKIYALYKKRREYKIKVSFENRHSYFNITYNGKTTMLSDKERDYVSVLEGYHFVAECVPVESKDKEGIFNHTYNFLKWGDGEMNQVREYFVTKELFNDFGEMRLFAYCDGKHVLDSMNFKNRLIPTEDNFEDNLPEYRTLESCVVDYFPSEDIVEFEGLKQIYDTEGINCVSLERDGYFIIDAGFDEVKDVRIDIKINTDNFLFQDEETGSYGQITVRNGDNAISADILTNEETDILFDFSKCESGLFEVSSTFSDLHIEGICVLERVIINKGLLELCVPPEDTKLFYTGVLNMNGVISVGGNVFGMESVQIGQVNKLNPINIITSEE